ncbi:FecR domain-containing protein [Methylomicrobium lacus]|uniref:FecR family protein n=1 Tax=Methylomicrobium lacus TaxID=136992 RepID=UPI0035A97A56
MESDLDNTVDEQAAAWFIRLRAANVSRQDEACFLQWLEQTDAHRKAFDEISALWGDPDLLKGLTASAQKHRIAPRSDKKRLMRSKMPLALAACLVLTLAFSGQFRMLINADYTSAVGERKSVRLEDGSTVMLNTDSALALSMDGTQRWVELLKGEAYFDVKPDPDRPFIVKADYSTTRVLGTHFIVGRNGDSDEIKVLSGRVEVSENGHWKDPVVLHDGQAVSVNSTALGQPKMLDSALSISWVDGFLVFENETLESVVKQIRRYRTGMILFKDDSLRAMKINGRLSIRESGDMLKVLQKTLAVKMTYLTDWLVIVG